VNSLRPSLDETYIKMLDLIALRSTCVRRSVGAIVVHDGKVIGMGYNGVPKGIAHCTEHPCRGATDAPGNNAQCEAIHAEQNALLYSNQILIKGSTIYTSTTPCFNCAKLIISAGIVRVVSKTLYAEMAGIRLLSTVGIPIQLWCQDEGQVGFAIPLSQDIIDKAFA
jgi:dCMP deaminase